MTLKRDEKGRILPGAGGRPAGTRNKLQGEFIKALADDFAEHGVGVIRYARDEKPVEYLKIIASILPKELIFTDDKFSEVDEEELLQALAFIRSQTGTDDGCETEH